MRCPICGTKRVDENPMDNDGEFAVAVEESDGQVAVVDTTIVAFVCENHHVFYVDPYQGEMR